MLGLYRPRSPEVPFLLCMTIYATVNEKSKHDADCERSPERVAEGLQLTEDLRGDEGHMAK